MPRLKLEALDEEPGTDQQAGFTGGQVSHARRNLLSPVQAARLQNCQLEETGPAQTRRGTEQLSTEESGGDRVQGLGYYDTPTVERLVRARGGAIQTHDGQVASAWQTASGYSPSASARVAMVQGIDKLYLSDGVNAVVSWNGSAFTTLADVPKGRCLLWATSRLIVTCVDTAPDTVYFSNILDATTGYDVAHSLRVGAGDGDPIVFAAMWTRTVMAVVKRASVWMVDIDPSRDVAEMTIQQAPSQVGCVGIAAWGKVGTDIWFLATDMTLRSLRRVLSGEDTDVPAISQPIADELAVVNRTHAHKSCAIAYGTRFLLAVPTWTSSEPDRVLSFNVQLQAWEGRWVGWAPTVWAVSYFSATHRLNFGQADGRVLRWLDLNPPIAETEADYEDAGGEDIETIIDTRAMTWGEPLNPKRAMHLEIEFNQCLTDEIEVTPIRDDVANAAPVRTLEDGVDGVILGLPGVRRASINMLHQAPAREWGVRIRAQRLKMAVRAVLMTAFIDTLPASSMPAFERVAGSGFMPGELPGDPTINPEVSISYESRTLVVSAALCGWSKWQNYNTGDWNKLRAKSTVLSGSVTFSNWSNTQCSGAPVSFYNYAWSGAAVVDVATSQLASSGVLTINGVAQGPQTDVSIRQQTNDDELTYSDYQMFQTGSGECGVGPVQSWLVQGQAAATLDDWDTVFDAIERGAHYKGTSRQTTAGGARGTISAGHTVGTTSLPASTRAVRARALCSKLLSGAAYELEVTLERIQAGGTTVTDSIVETVPFVAGDSTQEIYYYPPVNTDYDYRIAGVAIAAA